jgi:hypothetical protein
VGQSDSRAALWVIHKSDIQGQRMLVNALRLILLPPSLELNEILKKLPRMGTVFDARNLRKSFQAACVKVGLGVETGSKVWQYKGRFFTTSAGVASGI